MKHGFDLWLFFMYSFDLQLKKEFSNNVESAIAAMRGLSASHSSGQPDLTNLFKVAVHEAKKSNAQNRIFRVVSCAISYCYVSVIACSLYIIC